MCKRIKEEGGCCVQYMATHRNIYFRSIFAVFRCIYSSFLPAFSIGNFVLDEKVTSIQLNETFFATHSPKLTAFDGRPNDLFPSTYVSKTRKLSNGNITSNRNWLFSSMNFTRSSSSNVSLMRKRNRKIPHRENINFYF